MDAVPFVLFTTLATHALALTTVPPVYFSVEEIQTLLELSHEVCDVPLSCDITDKLTNVCKCACDIGCTYRGDCCLDTPYMKQIFSEPVDFEECTAFLDRNKSYFVVNECPSVSSSNLVDKCGASETLTDMVWITHGGSGTIFRNIGCALCHGSEPTYLVPWKPVARVSANCLQGDATTTEHTPTPLLRGPFLSGDSMGAETTVITTSTTTESAGFFNRGFNTRALRDTSALQDLLHGNDTSVMEYDDMEYVNDSDSDLPQRTGIISRELDFDNASDDRINFTDWLQDDLQLEFMNGSNDDILLNNGSDAPDSVTGRALLSGDNNVTTLTNSGFTAGIVSNEVTIPTSLGTFPVFGDDGNDSFTNPDDESPSGFEGNRSVSAQAVNLEDISLTLLLSMLDAHWDQSKTNTNDPKIPLETIFMLLDNYTADCLNSLLAPGSSEPSYKYCQRPIIVSTCDIALNAFINNFTLLIKACHYFNAPLTEDGSSIIYRNIFCYLCNTMPDDVTNWRTDEQSIDTPINKLLEAPTVIGNGTEVELEELESRASGVMVYEPVIMLVALLQAGVFW